MTDQRSASAARRTRRQLLAGGTGALAAAIAVEAMARPVPARAANGDNVILGQTNTATSGTEIDNTTDGGLALKCFATDGTAIVAECSGNGTGLSASTDSGTAVSGGGGSSGIGVIGSGALGAGVQGFSASNEGVYGQHGSTGSALTGVANGVHGVTGSATGSAVLGEDVSSGGTGVAGISQAGVAVLGNSPNGTGVSATGKTALKVTGPAVFSRSGKLTIAAGKTSATRTSVALTSGSIVLVTAQNDVSGAAVRSAVPDVSTSSFTVHLAKAVASAVTLGWFIAN